MGNMYETRSMISLLSSHVEHLRRQIDNMLTSPPMHCSSSCENRRLEQHGPKATSVHEVMIEFAGDEDEDTGDLDEEKLGGKCGINFDDLTLADHSLHGYTALETKWGANEAARLWREANEALAQTQCPMGHSLTEFAAPMDDATCGNCSDNFPKETIMHGCRKCDYDVCTSCLRKAGNEHTSSGSCGSSGAPTNFHRSSNVWFADESSAIAITDVTIEAQPWQLDRQSTLNSLDTVTIINYVSEAEERATNSVMDFLCRE